MMISTVSIMSCKRTPSFLEDTVKSIPDNLNIEIFYQGDVNEISFDNINIKQVDYIEDAHRVHHNSQYNYASTLMNSKDGFIVEDDIEFSVNFSSHMADLNNLLDNMQCKYALAIYSCYNWSKKGASLVDYPVEAFYGTQGMIYDIETARSFGNFLMGRIGVEPYDFALKTYIQEVDPDVRLLATGSSLIQHRGDLSTGLGVFHKAPNFVDHL